MHLIVLLALFHLTSSFLPLTSKVDQEIATPHSACREPSPIVSFEVKHLPLISYLITKCLSQVYIGFCSLPPPLVLYLDMTLHVSFP